MKTTKFITSASVLAIAALAAAGCGSSSSNTSSSTTAGSSSGGSTTTAVASPSTSATPAPPAGPAAGSGKGKKLALIQGTDADPFYITMACGAEAEAKTLGATISVQGPPTFSASQQIPIVNSVAAKKPNAVLITPTDVHALIAPMKQMKAQGIKLVQVDTSVTDTSLAVSSITSNNLYGGELAAKTLADLIGKKGSVVVINTEPGVSTTDARAQGFNQEMKSYPNIQVIKVQYDNDNANTAASLVTSLLSAHSNLSGIFAINTLTAGGVGTGLRQANAAGKVKVVGFDAEPQEIQQLNQNIVNALIAQQPYVEGQLGVEQAVDALTGKANTKNIGTKLVAITKSNLSSMSSYIYKSKC